MIDTAQDYLRRLDEGRPDLLDLFTEDAEIYFPKFGVTKGRQHLLEMLGGFGGQVEYTRHDYATLNFLPSGDSLVVEGTSQGKLAGKTWEGGKLPADVFAMSSASAMAGYRACTFISTQTTRGRMHRDFVGDPNAFGEPELNRSISES